jgi:S-adenosylmethionine synthetase
VTYSGVQLHSRVGDPVAEPWVVDVTTTADDAAVADVVRTELDAIDSSERTSSRGLSTCSEDDGPQ